MNNIISTTLTELSRITMPSAEKFLHAEVYANNKALKYNRGLLDDLKIVLMYLIVLRWRVEEQNTFFLEEDDCGCKKYLYPSTLPESKMIVGFIDKFICKYNINITKLLKDWGVVPLGRKPDGISFMFIKEGDVPCDDNLFQINKTRR